MTGRRFSLRTGLLVMTIACVFAAILGRYSEATYHESYRLLLSLPALAVLRVACCFSKKPFRLAIMGLVAGFNGLMLSPYPASATGPRPSYWEVVLTDALSVGAFTVGAVLLAVMLDIALSVELMHHRRN